MGDGPGLHVGQAGLTLTSSPALQHSIIVAFYGALVNRKRTRA